MGDPADGYHREDKKESFVRAARLSSSSKEAQTGTQHDIRNMNLSKDKNASFPLSEEELSSLRGGSNEFDIDVAPSRTSSENKSGASKPTSSCTNKSQKSAKKLLKLRLKTKHKLDRQHHVHQKEQRRLIADIDGERWRVSVVFGCGVGPTTHRKESAKVTKHLSSNILHGHEQNNSSVSASYFEPNSSSAAVSPSLRLNDQNNREKLKSNRYGKSSRKNSKLSKGTTKAETTKKNRDKSNRRPSIDIHPASDHNNLSSVPRKEEESGKKSRGSTSDDTNPSKESSFILSSSKAPMVESSSSNEVSQPDQSSDAVSTKDVSKPASATSACPKNKVRKNDDKISREALSFLSSFLSAFKPHDVLDEDEVQDVMMASENAALQRIRRRTEDPTYDCCYSSEEDEYDCDGECDLMYGADFLNEAREAAAAEAAEKVKDVQKYIDKAPTSISTSTSASFSENDMKVTAEVSSEASKKDPTPDSKATISIEAPVIFKPVLSKKTIQILRGAMDMQEGGRSMSQNVQVAPELLGKKRKRKKPDSMHLNDDRHSMFSTGQHYDQVGDAHHHQWLNNGAYKGDNNDNVAEHGVDKKKRENGMSPAKRLTRGMVRDTRNKRREERDARNKMGIESLVHAVFDIEEDDKKKSGTKKQSAGDGGKPVNILKDTTVPKKKRFLHKKDLTKEKNEGHESTTLPLENEIKDKSETVRSKKSSSVQELKEKPDVTSTQQATDITRKKKKKKKLSGPVSTEETAPKLSVSSSSSSLPSPPLSSVSSKTSLPSQFLSQPQPLHPSSSTFLPSTQRENTKDEQKGEESVIEKDGKTLKRKKKKKVRVVHDEIISESTALKVIIDGKAGDDATPFKNTTVPDAESSTTSVNEKSQTVSGGLHGISHVSSKTKKNKFSASVSMEEGELSATLSHSPPKKKKKKRHREETNSLVDTDEEGISEMTSISFNGVANDKRKHKKKSKRKKSDADLSSPTVSADTPDKPNDAAQQQKSSIINEKRQESVGDQSSTTSSTSKTICLMAVLPDKVNGFVKTSTNQVRVMRVIVNGRAFKPKKRRREEDAIPVSMDKQHISAKQIDGERKVENDAIENKKTDVKKRMKSLSLHSKESTAPTPDDKRSESVQIQHKTIEEEPTTKRTESDRHSSVTKEKERRKIAKTTSKRNRKVLPTAKKRSQCSHSDLDEGPLFGELCEDATGKPPISLSLLDWRRRQQWIPSSKQPENFDHIGAEDSENVSVSVGNPPGLGKLTTNIVMPNYLAQSRLSTGIPLLEATNINAEIPEKPGALDPPRRKHSNKTYATMCSKVINFLTSSGRHYPRYEFFYSDIDRAWFNDNEFQKDAAKLGIPLTAKLTRAEWSSIRRCMPRRPRRFSKSFISSQMEKLNEYRRCVRKIQNDPDTQAVKNFGFEVSAPIKVGAVVTAYNKGARFLHRGVVLTRDVLKEGYLIQFERKSFGFEFCPDTEVAGHGTPDIIIPHPEVALDGSSVGALVDSHTGPGALPSGTTNGPLVDHHKVENNHAISQMASLMDGNCSAREHLEAESANLDLSQQEACLPMANYETGATKPDCLDLTGSSYVMVDEETATSITEKTAERKTLVELMYSLNTMLTRKEMLLDEIEKCHQAIQDHTDAAKDGKKSDDEHNSHTDVLSGEKFRAFREHLAWLYANLRLNNKTLETALVFLQVMYSKSYVGSPGFIGLEDKAKECINKETQIRKQSNAFVPSKEVEKTWAKTLSQKCINVGSEMAANFFSSTEGCNLEAKEYGKNLRTTNNIDNHRSKYLGSRLSSALSLLLATESCLKLMESSDDNMRSASFDPSQDVRRILHAGPGREVLEEALQRMTPPDIPGLLSHANNLDESRDAGYKALKEAVSMMHAELAALNFQES